MGRGEDRGEGHQGQEGEEGEEERCFYCGDKQDLVRCDGCPLLICPDPAHGLAHRPMGRCMPFKVDFHPDYGRILVATRAISSGEVVLLDTALVLAPGDEPGCLGCGGEIKADGFRCANCGFPMCSQSCSSSCFHAEECHVLARCGRAPVIAPVQGRDGLIPGGAKQHFIYKVVAILRFLLAQEKDDSAKRELSRLETHLDKRLLDPSVSEALSRIASFLRSECAVSSASFERVAFAFCALKTNAVGVSGSAPSTWQAVYPVVAMASHSCMPNLDPMPQVHGRMGLRAQRAVAVGEQLTVRYSASVGHRARLRRGLRDAYCFACRCQRCHDASDMTTFMSSPMCNACRDNDDEAFLVPSKPLEFGAEWSCTKCRLSFPESDILATDDNVEAEASTNCHTESQMLDLISSLERLSHPAYHTVIRLKCRLVLSSPTEDTSVKAWTNRRNFCMQLLNVLAKVDPGNTRTRAGILKALAVATLNMNK